LVERLVRNEKDQLRSLFLTALTCSFIGKALALALSQVFSNALKKYRRWIKPFLGRLAFTHALADRIFQIIDFNVFPLNGSRFVPHQQFLPSV
jgi:hypothetical protein